MSSLLSLVDIHKTFFAIHAVNGVSLEIQPGEIVSLIGENGAGKSTLSKIVAGVYRLDSGKMFWNGQEIDSKNYSVSDAQKLGISMIFQETNLVPHLNVAENIFLGREPLRKIPYVLDYQELHGRAKEEMEKLGISIETDIPVRKLTPGYKQQVEIVKALSMNPKLIIMDEPSSSLSIEETRKLLGIVKELKKQGICVIYISHKLNEVLEISDRIVVMRDGKKVDEKPVKEMTKETMVRAMVGRDIQAFFPKEKIKEGKEIFRVENLQNLYLSNPVTFALQEGEILGFAGLIGAGRTELMQSIFGVIPCLSGAMYVQGNQISIHSPLDAITHGIGYVPEDRREQGLIFSLPVGENMILSIMRILAKIGIRKFNKENEIARDYVTKLNIKPPDIENKILNLSGGNQQKVVLGKWLASSLKVLILDEPTRGIDVGAKAEIHSLIIELAKKGMGIILVSSEMEEIIGMCDRVLVLRKGKLAGEIFKEKISEESIMQLAAHA